MHTSAPHDSTLHSLAPQDMAQPFTAVDGLLTHANPVLGLPFHRPWATAIEANLDNSSLAQRDAIAPDTMALLGASTIGASNNDGHGGGQTTNSGDRLSRRDDGGLHGAVTDGLLGQQQDPLQQGSLQRDPEPSQRRIQVQAQRRTRRVSSILDFNADLSRGGQFYRVPYPSDMRLNRRNQPKLSGFPISSRSLLAANLRQGAGDRTFFPVNTPGYFRFNGALKPQSSDVVIPTRRRSPVWLVNVDPDSENWGKRYPTVAATLDPDPYVPDHLLGVAPAPGLILEPNTTYAYMVRRSLRDENGKLLRAAPQFQTLQEGDRPDVRRKGKVRRLYNLLWDVLDAQRIKRKSVAIATVFSTGDVVADMEALSDQVLERYDVTFKNLTLQPDITDDARFHYLKGTVDLPQFQSGIPPFNFIGGQFQFDSDDELLLQRVERDVPIVLTLPKTPMPEGGYPLVAYYHGSNGLSTQVVDRGPITEPGGTPTPGLGPAHVLAEAGFATLGMAMPLAPERVGGNSNDGYLNPLNLSAYRDTFRQGVIEQRLLFEALSSLTLDPALVTPSVLPTQDSGTSSDRTNSDRPNGGISIHSDSFFVLGQSHGAQYAAMLGAVEPKVKVVIPTGSGGYWPLLVTESSDASIASLALGTFKSLDLLHPALALLSTTWEAAEPIVYMPRMAQRPLPNHPARSVYQPVAPGDTQFPTSVFDAVALATGVQQAGASIWPEMQTVLQLNRLNTILDYPVSNNLLSDNGQAYTGVVVQYEGDGISDPHTIFTQLDAVQVQYASFFKSAWETGTATLVDPLGTDLGSPVT